MRNKIEPFSVQELVSKVLELSRQHPNAKLLVMGPAYGEYDYVFSNITGIGYEPELGFYEEWTYWSKEEFLDDCGEDIDAESIPEFNEYIVICCDN